MKTLRPIIFIYSFSIHSKQIRNRGVEGLQMNIQFSRSKSHLESHDCEEISIDAESSYGEVKIYPSSFKDPPPLPPASPLEPRNKWFINLSNKNIPTEVQGLLQLGEGFCLPTITDNSKAISEFIKHIENNLLKIQERDSQLKTDIRNRSLTILKNLHHNNCVSSDMDNKIKNAVKTKKIF